MVIAHYAVVPVFCGNDHGLRIACKHPARPLDYAETGPPAGRVPAERVHLLPDALAAETMQAA